MEPDGMIFYAVTALSANAAAVVAMPEGAGDGCDGDESSCVLVSTSGGWVAAPPVPWPTVACLDTEDALVNVGLYGHLQHLPWAGGEIRETQLPTSPALPLRVQGARRVGDLLYVCGMQRQVLVSPDGSSWATMNDGLEPGPDEPVTSLSNLAGNGTSLVAVGLHGSVYRSDGGPWQPLVSGVRSWLKDVAWHEGAFWICGKNGLLLTGDVRSPQKLTRIHSGTTGTLHALKTFQGRLYALGDNGLFRIDGTSTIPVTTPGTPRAIDVCDDALWVVTEQRDLFVSDDGEHFARRG
ncbi:hypothetical protein KZZ52_22975 [Dactylosporangium sp. AC04546]|uniref:hypothetical protein n=1 Tax=Dactylosporangium sp. AC04546 TaxID=2862460 RepID=UPI001EDCBB2C|nr:hypothetical protein [Dactylosporangium sp. AC04546]WVK88142.1 hypothetical protein KZZ52_22975 [Dactylosporangium sp. AC04546]